jgi:predicted RNA-binding protein with TRAM domain
VARFEQHLADVVGLGGVEVAHFAPDHLRDDLRDVHVGHGGGGDVLAVADHGDGVAHRRHFIELVGDVHAGHALGLEVTDDVEQHLDFRAGQGRGGFVEDQQARLLLRALAISTSCWWPPPYCDTGSATFMSGI